MDKQILDNYTEVLQSQFDHYYSGFIMHPEEGRECKINNEIENIKNDLIQIDTALITAGDQVYKLMTNTILRLNNIHNNIMTEKERFQDMQMLCNKYNDYDNVKILNKSNFKNTDFVYDEESSLIMPRRTSVSNVKLTVLDISGNGYEGNKYVYKDYIYTNTVVDTSRREYITDNKETSYYEYSRITVNNDSMSENEDFNKDNKEAQCTITFQAADGINEIEIKSDDSTIEVLGVSYSLDGIEYTELDIPYISINNKTDSYEKYGYIYGAGQIAFPQKIQYFKVTLKSNGYKNDTIAYEHTYLSEGSYLSEDDTYEEIKQTVIDVSAKRHVIKINDVEAGMYKYPPKSQIQTHDLLNGQSVNAISVFANVYVPQGIGDDAVRFLLTVNGLEHEVVPINSHKNGIKIVRFSTGNASSPYTQRIGEKIKSAYLTIIFTNTSKIAPRINNLKILIGGEL